MKVLLRFVVALLALVALAAGAAWRFVVIPEVAAIEAPGARQDDEVVLVPAGANTKQVAQLLHKHGMVRDPRFFYYYARYMKLASPRPGEFSIGAQLSAREAFLKITRGEVITYEISFPEGLNYLEIAKRLDASPLIDGATLIRLCEDKAFLKAHGVEGETCEGYLFPDTYRFPKGIQPSDIVAAMLKHHRELYEKEIEPKRASTGLTRHQLVTLASIVEKETGAEEERPRIARVFLNRLKLKMPLATDPTVIYAVRKHLGSFDGNLKRDHLTMDIPYNTYKRPGLPPGPISNPGLKALQAVIAPTDGNDLYFVSRNDGHHVFCPTFECHDANVKKWQVEFFRKKRAEKAMQKNPDKAAQKKSTDKKSNRI